MKSINELIRPHLRNLVPYSSARDEFDRPAEIWLDANESPFNNGVNRYPDPYQTELKKAIAKNRGVALENIFVGNGSDEAIDLLFRAFCEPQKDEVIITPPTYGMYAVSATINNVDCVEAPLNENFSLNTEKVLGKVTEWTKIIFLCSPNNPTGNALRKEDIMQILENFNGLVVVDEAYGDFYQEESWTKSLNKKPQLVVLQTFSKSLSAAGLRVGMLFAHPEIVKILNKIKPPYNVNVLSQQMALELLKEEEKFEKNIGSILVEKEKLRAALVDLAFVKRVMPSDANFWLLQVENANHLYDYLAKKGIVVRNRSKQLNCEQMLRITIGTPKENEKLIEVLKKYNHEESIVH